MFGHQRDIHIALPPLRLRDYHERGVRNIEKIIRARDWGKREQTSIFWMLWTAMLVNSEIVVVYSRSSQSTLHHGGVEPQDCPPLA